MQLEMAGMDAVRVKKLFITHMHGDHCFGIGGLLRAVSAAREGTSSADVPFTVYGPPGLHKLVTAALGFDERPLAMPLVRCSFCQSMPGWPLFCNQVL